MTGSIFQEDGTNGGYAVDLDGKVAIVTGASRGVGAATAIALAEAGCRVACAARSTKEAPQRTPGTLDDTVARAKNAGTEAIAIPTDLSKRDDVRRMVAETVERFGGVDVLINNAAVTFIGDLDQPERRHDLTFAVNYWAPYIAIQSVSPHMERRNGGAIINVSSMAALVPLPDMLAYGTSKIALEHLTLDTAANSSPQGHRRELLPDRHRLRVGGHHRPTCPVPISVRSSPVRCPRRASFGCFDSRRTTRAGARACTTSAEREGIMPTRITSDHEYGPTPTELFDGLYQAAPSNLIEPYD